MFRNVTINSLSLVFCLWMLVGGIGGVYMYPPLYWLLGAGVIGNLALPLYMLYEKQRKHANNTGPY